MVDVNGQKKHIPEFLKGGRTGERCGFKGVCWDGAFNADPATRGRLAKAKLKEGTDIFYELEADRCQSICGLLLSWLLVLHLVEEAGPWPFGPMMPFVTGSAPETNSFPMCVEAVFSPVKSSVMIEETDAVHVQGQN